MDGTGSMRPIIAFAADLQNEPVDTLEVLGTRTRLTS